MQGENYQDCHDCKYWYMGGCWNIGGICPKGKLPSYIKCEVCGKQIKNDTLNHLCDDCRNKLLELINDKQKSK